VEPAAREYLVMKLIFLRALALLVLLVSLSGLVALEVGCGDGTSTAPLDPGSEGLAVFTDPASGFSTADVRDVDDQIMRFKPTERTLLWVEGNLVFDGWIVDGNFLAEGHPYEVRFGTVSGQRRAYFTETGRGTLCDLEVEGNVLQIRPTNTLPPQT
jgi:hypothetical protein